MRLSNLCLWVSFLFLISCGGSSDNSSTPFLSPDNDAPVVAVANADQTALVGVDINYDVTQGGTTFTDADGQTLTITVAFDPAGSGLTATDGVITGAPVQTGVITVTVTASDGFAQARDVFTITVTNQAPVVAAANADQAEQVGYAVNYDTTQGGTTFTDADGQALTVTVAFDPADNGLTAADGVITGMPEQTGAIGVTVTADDGFAQVVDTFTINVTADQNAVQAKFAGRIDLENLETYTNPAVPDYFREPNVVLNPVTDKGATVGRAIFYDDDLSVTGFVACSTCHMQANAFSEGDDTPTSQGIFGEFTNRSSTRLVNTLYGEEERFFWDERAENMEDQVTRPFKDHNEHGFSGEMGRPDFDDMIAIMQADEAYRELFRFAFLDEIITEELIQSALAQFVHSIVSFDSKYDEGRALVADDMDPFPNFTAEENAGKNLFMRPAAANDGAGCAGCHVPPEFAIRTDMGTNGVVGVALEPGEFDFTNTRAPALRDVLNAGGTRHSRFMHDGSLTTLRDVLNHYDNIPVPAGEPERTEFLNTIDNRLIDVGTPRVLNLSEVEKDQIIAFLATLTGTDIYVNEKWRNPNF